MIKFNKFYVTKRFNIYADIIPSTMLLRMNLSFLKGNIHSMLRTCHNICSITSTRVYDRESNLGTQVAYKC